MKLKLLNLTSLLYIVPFLQAWSVHHDPVFRYGLGGILVTSQIYHATHHPISLMVDLALVHFMVTYHVWYALYCRVFTWRICFMYGAIVYSGISFWILRLSKQNDLYHAVIHVLTCMGSYFLLSEPLCIPSSAIE